MLSLILSGPFAVIYEHFNSILPNCYDAIGLMLMIRIIHQHQTIFFTESEQVNISLWPRFKMVFDLHLGSLCNANVRTLWEDDIHPNYVMRRYAELTASLIHLNVEYGDGQLELNMERLRMAVDELLMKLTKMFPRPKLQIVFMINNYDMTIAVLKVRTMILHAGYYKIFICTKVEILQGVVTFLEILFQSEVGSISLDIKILQKKSMDMGLKLKNRKVWFLLGKFCIPEDSVVILILLEDMMVVSRSDIQFYLL
ncbi:hypothetical protein Pint_07060 [Pistacia integerrima]|uniref:Uncharacterized protein n=1 Tax=Pistacia integerrima TaxID=434235 RepID=A0ACC0XUD2_9ROSI|nr:hypothetical protein Pint_07060 [Pistacia integerrima]